MSKTFYFGNVLFVIQTQLSKQPIKSMSVVRH